MDGLGVLLWAFFFKTCKIWSSKVKEDKTVRDNILYRVTDKNWATVSHLEACHIFQSNKTRSPWTTLCIFSKQVVFDLGISALSYNFPKKMVRKKKKTDDVIARHYCKDWRERFTFICGIFFFFFFRGGTPTGGPLHAHPRKYPFLFVSVLFWSRNNWINICLNKRKPHFTYADLFEQMT